MNVSEVNKMEEKRIFTESEIKNMTPAEHIKNKDEIIAATNEGRIRMGE